MKEQIKKAEAFQREAEAKAAKQASDLDRVFSVLATLQQDLREQSVQTGKSVERIEARFQSMDARFDQLAAMVTGLTHQQLPQPVTQTQLLQQQQQQQHLASAAVPLPHGQNPPSRDRSPRPRRAPTPPPATAVAALNNGD